MRGWPSPEPLEPIVTTGANAVLVPVRLVQSGIHGHDLRWAHGLDRPAAWSRNARGRGLDVFWMPVIEVKQGERGHWRGVLAPRRPDAWWAAYRRHVVDAAERAGRIGAAGLVVGSELSSLQGVETRGRWRRIVEAVRLRYAGKLIYAANHDALDDVAPFGLVDWIGVSAYFPLARGLEPERSELRASWAKRVDRLRRLHAEWNLPLLLVEVGAPSVDGAAREPWDYASGAPLDLEEQALVYRATADALRNAAFVHGAFFWGWFGPGGRFDRSHTPRNKPAEPILRSLLREKTACDAAESSAPGSAARAPARDRSEP